MATRLGFNFASEREDYIERLSSARLILHEAAGDFLDNHDACAPLQAMVERIDTMITRAERAAIAASSLARGGRVTNSDA